MENAGLKRVLDNKRDVLCVDCALLRMVYVVPADVRVLIGIAGGLYVNAESGGSVLDAPASARLMTASASRCAVRC